MENNPDERSLAGVYLKETLAELRYARGNRRRTELLTAEVQRLERILKPHQPTNPEHGEHQAKKRP